MAETCWLECPELFEEFDPSYGSFGAFGDTAVDNPDMTIEEARELDPKLVEDWEAYNAKRSEVARNCDENYETCSGPTVVYDIKTRKPFMICPITPEPYYMPIDE